MSDWLKREQVVAALKDAQTAPPYQDRGIMAKDAVKLFRMALAALDAHADHAAEVARLDASESEAYSLYKITLGNLGRMTAERDTLAERVRVLEAQANITDRLFLRVLSQALGEDDNRELHHLFMSAYEQACAWVECKGYGERTDIGARLKDDPFDAEVSWGEMDALAQPQPCKTCGGTGERWMDDYPGAPCGEGSYVPCPDCQPQQKEKGGKP